MPLVLRDPTRCADQLKVNLTINFCAIRLLPASQICPLLDYRSPVDRSGPASSYSQLPAQERRLPATSPACLALFLVVGASIRANDPV
jgi:hypothetical protein